MPILYFPMQGGLWCCDVNAGSSLIPSLDHPVANQIMCINLAIIHLYIHPNQRFLLLQSPIFNGLVGKFTVDSPINFMGSSMVSGEVFPWNQSIDVETWVPRRATRGIGGEGAGATRGNHLGWRRFFMGITGSSWFMVEKSVHSARIDGEWENLWLMMANDD